MKPMLTDCYILAALEFEDQATDWLLLFALEGYEDLGAAQKEDTNYTPRCNLKDPRNINN